MFRDYALLPRTVFVLCLGTLVNRAGTFLAPFLTLYVTDQLGLSAEFATTAMGAFGLGAIFAALAGGQLADTIGRRAVMLMALVGGAGVLVAISFAVSQTSILLLLVLFGFVSEMYRPAASAMIADVVPPEQRAHAFGLMYLAINLGFTIAPLVGGLLTRVSYRLLFWGDAATACAYAVILILCVRESLPPKLQAAGNTPNAPDCGARSSASTSANDQSSFKAAFRHMATDKTMLMFCFAMLFTACVYTQAFSTFPLYLREKSIDAAGYGRIIAVNGLMIVLLQVPITAIVTRFNRAGVMVAATLMTAAGFGMIGFGESGGFLAMTVVVWTIGEIMQVPFMSAIVSDLAPVHLRARYMGLLSMSFAAAMLIGAPVGGRVFAAWGGKVLWPSAAGLAVVSALLLLSIRRAISDRGDRREN